MTNNKIQYDGRNLRVLVVPQPRAAFIMNGHETTFARDDDSITFKLREIIALCSGPQFIGDSFEVVRNWMSVDTWETYARRPVDSYPLNALIGLVKVFSCRWLDEMCGQACLCRPEGRFGITLVEPEIIDPAILLLSKGKGLNIKIPKVEKKSGQHLLF